MRLQIYEKIPAVSGVFEQFDILFPKTSQTEKITSNFFDTEDGEKTISPAFFNTYTTFQKKCW